MEWIKIEDEEPILGQMCFICVNEIVRQGIYSGNKKFLTYHHLEGESVFEPKLWHKWPEPPKD